MAAEKSIGPKVKMTNPMIHGEAKSQPYLVSSA